MTVAVPGKPTAAVYPHSESVQGSEQHQDHGQARDSHKEHGSHERGNAPGLPGVPVFSPGYAAACRPAPRARSCCDDCAAGARVKAVSGLLGRLPLLAAVCLVLVCLAAGCAVTGSGGGHVVEPSRATAGHSKHVPSRPRPSRGQAEQLSVPAIGGDPAQLAGQLTTAESTLAGAAAAPMARQALIVQMACLRVAAHPGWAGMVIAQVAPAQRAAAATDIAATADLVMLTAPRTTLPPWRIVAPKSMAALRADYQAAQAATGVGWFYLAAINFVETDFGRVAGRSTAGAQGPMQFLPATWAIYGHGSIHRPKDAILAAAHLLADHGAAGNIAAAVYAYNPSWRYVDAVLRYARRLRHDPQALAGYYHRRVICRLASGWVLLPAGYGSNPGAQPITLHL